MDLAKRDIAPDHVSRFIRALAVGMLVLGVVFAALDRYQLLPQLPLAQAGSGPA
jgi:hypothetical protein